MKVDYYDFAEVVNYFWTCSVKNDFSDFDWIAAFNMLQGPMEQKLTEHGLLSLEAFQEQEDDLYDYGILSELGTSTTYIQITPEELKTVIQEYKYKRFREEFEDYETFQTLESLFFRLLDAQNIEKADQFKLKDFIILFDEVIHAQHETGNIYDYDIEEMRKDFEKN